MFGPRRRVVITFPARNTKAEQVVTAITRILQLAGIPYQLETVEEEAR